MPIAAEAQSDPLRKELKTWLENNQHLNGAAILQYLMKHANLPVHVSFIDRQIYCRRPAERWEEYSQACAYGLICVFEEARMADSPTLGDCLERHKKCLKEIQACRDLNDEYGAEKAELEARRINAYLKEVKTPTGALKRFPPPWSLSGRMVNKNLSYTMQKLQAGHPELAAYVKKHLKRGKAFMWHDPDDDEDTRYSANAHWYLENQ